LPGTTASAEIKGQNSSPFVGVLRVSATRALAAMELSCEKLHARKSWVVDGDSIVCVGSDIRAPGKVETTVFNQAVMSSAPLIVDGRPMPDENFERDVQPQWVWIERMGYVFPRKQTLHVLRQDRASDWTSVREAERHGAGERHQHSFLTGVLPQSSEQDAYAYIVLPNVTAERMPELAHAALARYRIESQANHRVTAADESWEARVLWGPTTGESPTSNAGCLLLREEQQWTMADPTWSGRPIQLTIGHQAYEITCEHGRPAPVALK
jgi:hypothetical protein